MLCNVLNSRLYLSWLLQKYVNVLYDMIYDIYNWQLHHKNSFVVYIITVFTINTYMWKWRQWFGPLSLPLLFDYEKEVWHALS